MHAARKQERRLAAALLAAAVAHTPEAEEALRGARMRMARKPSAVARELLRNFPRSGGKRRRQRRRKGGKQKGQGGANGAKGAANSADESDVIEDDGMVDENGGDDRAAESNGDRSEAEVEATEAD